MEQAEFKASLGAVRRLGLHTIIALSMMTVFSIEAKAVAFKLKNDASFSVRVRVSDRGTWRPWVTFNPGGWGIFAEKVERAHHQVQLEVWTSTGWDPVYSRTHGSFMFTRVLQIIDSSDGLPILAWWDQPHGCRSMPPHPTKGGSTCLKECGWVQRALYKAAVRIGKAYVAGQ